MDESSPNPASPSKSTKKSHHSRNKNNNDIPPYPTASASLTRENFGPASSTSQQRQIIRLDGETTIEDLERENAALLKSQHSLFLMNTKQKRTLDTLEAEHQSITKREAEAQFHIAALQMELQTLAERLGSSSSATAIGGENNIPNLTVSEQTPPPPNQQQQPQQLQQQEQSTPGSFRYSEIMNRLEAKNNNFNVSESPNGQQQQQQSQSGATSLNFNHSNYQQGANRGALFELSTSGTTTARTTMTTQTNNNQQHHLSSLNLKNMYIPGAHVEWGEDEGEGYFEKHQVDKSNNTNARKALNSNFFSSSSDSPESNLSPVVVHAPRGSEQHHQQISTITTTNNKNNAAAVVTAATDLNSHDSPSPKNNNNNASSSSPAQTLENSRAFLMKSQTPEQFGGRLWEQCEDVWRLKAELQVVWESRRRFDQLLKAALVRLRDAETEIDENNTVVLPGFKKRVEDDRDERLRLEEEVDHAHDKIKSLEQELKSTLRQIQQQQLQIDQMVVAARQQQQLEKISNINNKASSPLRSQINSSFAGEEQETKNNSNNQQQNQQQTNDTTTTTTTTNAAFTRGEKIDLDENDKFLRTTSVVQNNNNNNNALSPAPYDSGNMLAVVRRATSLMQLQLLDLHATTNTISPSRTYGGTNVGDIRDLRRLERELALSKKREAMWKLRHDQLFAQLERGTELLLDRYADPLKHAVGSSSFYYASSPSNSRFLDDVYNNNYQNNNYGGGSLSPRSRGGFLTYSSIGSPFLSRTNNVNLNNATRTARFSPESGRRSQPQQQQQQQFVLQGDDSRSQSRSNNANSVSPQEKERNNDNNVNDKKENNNNTVDERSPEPVAERIDQE